MHAEMSQQPEVLRRLAARFASLAAQVRTATGSDVPGVAFLARGSSDNAALLGRYAVELAGGLPTCLVAPSLITSWDRYPRRFDRWLLVALSQSGRTPEIVTVAERFRHASATILAVTNDPASPLAGLAHLSIDLQAGPEQAVPATKTVTAQMLAVLAVAAGVGDRGITAGQAAQIPGAVARVLADPAPVRHVAGKLAARDRAAVIGRAHCYPAALETALKLQETTGIMAHGFSTADFRHGPIAVCGPGSPAVLLAGSSAADHDTRALVPELAGRTADVTIIGTGPHAVIAWNPLGHAGECLLATVRGQQLAYHLAAARGVDPDQPAGLNKITLTR
jgi:glutamine---fructose-6-phosphate transaminase (isomerizing)